MYVKQGINNEIYNNIIKSYEKFELASEGEAFRVVEKNYDDWSKCDYKNKKNSNERSNWSGQNYFYFTHSMPLN